MSLDHDTTSTTGSFATPVLSRHFTVLVVDQDPATGDQVTKELEGAGVRVLRASTGMQGYWLAISKDPDVIVTELGMPNGGRADLVECLKDAPQTRNIPIIVHTAQNYPGMLYHLERLGAVAVVNKGKDRLGDLLELVEGLSTSES
ncbi:MAG: response regulator [Planctomycetota bacterium]|nr:response regulator [Planctomycetota bacterium]